MTGMKTGPKVVVIGAGSFFFCRPVIWNMTHSPVLRAGTLALVDTRPDILKTALALARRTIAATKAPLKLVGSCDRREVLKDADFVVFTFSERNAFFRGMDCDIALKNGIRMCSGDTIGPGGIFRALREIPRALEMARDVENLAPDAWVINFVNPTAVLGIALMRYAPNVRSFAICDGLHEPYYHLNICKAVGILPDETAAIPPAIAQKLDIRVAGVNHFTWMIRFMYEGRDMMPAWRAYIARRAKEEMRAMGGGAKAHGGQMDNNAKAKAKYNWNYALQLLDIFGAYPDRIAHTKEYVPFWQGHGVHPAKPAPLAIFDAKQRQQDMDARWAETTAFARGKKPIGEFLKSGRGDHATDIIESMWGGLGKPFYVNTRNRRAVTNMAEDAFLELRCDVDMSGPRPQPIGEMPRGPLGLTQVVLDTHELTAQAAATCDRDLLLRAFMTDPIVTNIEDAKAIIEESLARQRDILPRGWYGRQR